MKLNIKINAAICIKQSLYKVFINFLVYTLCSIQYPVQTITLILVIKYACNSANILHIQLYIKTFACTINVTFFISFCNTFFIFYKLLGDLIEV